MSGGKCPLKKCQGRRGCLCPKKKVASTPVFAGVSDDNVITVEEQMQMQKKTRTKPKELQPQLKHISPTKRNQVRSSPQRKEKVTTTKGSNTQGRKKINNKSSSYEGDADSSIDDHTTSTTNTTVDEKQQTEEDTVAEVVPVEGKCTLCYNHYKHEFSITYPPGSISVDEIKDRFSFDYGFKGNYKVHVIGPGEKGPRLHEAETTTITGFEIGKEYWCDVEEDAALADVPKKTYTATTTNSAIRVGSDGDAAFGEDRASCSCLEGNPCQSKYNCKDWNNRFDVAKRNGWKGF
eukprot:m.23158 g.23158  ORF g.23158 m.23158 type:complete len:292 (-) comp8947_c0_seq1:165-1040(-)